MRKDVFIDGHERSDVVEDRENFLTRMEDFKPYIVEFEEPGPELGTLFYDPKVEDKAL